MQYEYDKTVDQLREGREGLEQYRWSTRHPPGRRRQVASGQLGSQGEGLFGLQRSRIGGKYALVQRPGKRKKKSPAAMHEDAYNNNVEGQARDRQARGTAAENKSTTRTSKMSRARPGASSPQNFNLDVTTDLARSRPRFRTRSASIAPKRVAAGLSAKGSEHQKSTQGRRWPTRPSDFEAQQADHRESRSTQGPSGGIGIRCQDPTEKIHGS